MKIFQKNIIYKIFFVLLSGCLIPFSFSPFNYYFLSIISLSLLFYLWTKSKSPRESFTLGYIFGFSMFDIGVNWLHISINLFGGINIYFAILITYLLIAFLSLYPAICGYISTKYFKNNLFLSLPALWFISEWARGIVLTGFPWLNIGTSQTDSILINFAPLIGDYGVTFIVCIIASCIVKIIAGGKINFLIGIVPIFLVFSLSILFSQINWTKSKNQDLNITIIQGAIPQEIKWQQNQDKKSYKIYSDLTKPFWKSDLIIWPETAISSIYDLSNEYIKKIEMQKEKSDVIFVTGIIRQNKTNKESYNSMLLIDNKHYIYDKYHLVPFGEYLPFKEILYNFIRFFKIPISNFSKSKSRLSNIDTEKANFGMSICYEDAFGSEIRRSMPHADILINVSNDAWFGDSFAPHQHLQIARMRAVENGRYFLRSTNTGISAVINNKGEIIANSPQFEKYTINENVTLYSGVTPFSKYGNKFLMILCSLILLFSYIFDQRKYKKIIK